MSADLKARFLAQLNANTRVVHHICNSYCSNAALREDLFQELKGHVQETDAGAPIPWGPWSYFARTVEGHLTNVFNKLDVKARTDLPGALAAPMSIIAKSRNWMPMPANECAYPLYGTLSRPVTASSFTA